MSSCLQKYSNQAILMIKAGSNKCWLLSHKFNSDEWLASCRISPISVLRLEEPCYLCVVICSICSYNLTKLLIKVLGVLNYVKPFPITSCVLHSVQVFTISVRVSYVVSFKENIVFAHVRLEHVLCQVNLATVGYAIHLCMI